MGIVTYEEEAATSIPPATIFKALVLDGHNVLPKAVPHAIKSIDIIGGGEIGVGTIKHLSFADASPVKYMKEKIEKLDTENLIHSVTIFESDAFEAGKVEKMCVEAKVEASPDGGSIVKTNNKIYTLEGFELKEEEIKARKERSAGLFKAVEAYLLVNP